MNRQSNLIPLYTEIAQIVLFVFHFFAVTTENLLEFCENMFVQDRFVPTTAIGHQLRIFKKVNKFSQLNPIEAKEWKDQEIDYFKIDI